jgi:outer membrane protein
MTPEGVQARPDLVARSQQLNVDVQRAERLRALRERERSATRETAFRPVNEAYLEILNELVEERQFDLLMERSNVLYASASIDISDDVIAILNERLSTVPVNRVRLPQQSPEGVQAQPQQ